VLAQILLLPSGDIPYSRFLYPSEEGRDGVPVRANPIGGLATRTDVYRPYSGSADLDPQIGGSLEFEIIPDLRQDGPLSSGVSRNAANTSGPGSGSSSLPEPTASGRTAGSSRRSPEVNDDVVSDFPVGSRSRCGDRSSDGLKLRDDCDRSPEVFCERRAWDTSRSRRSSLDFEIHRFPKSRRVALGLLLCFSEIRRCDSVRVS
jgi:hypothetical protein